MGLADYTKKITLKEILYFFLITFGTESVLIFTFMLDKNIRIQICKFNFLFDFIYFFLLLINKYLKSNSIYIISLYFTSAFRMIANMAIVFIIYSIGFSFDWFLPLVIIYSLFWLLLLFPADQLKKINTFFIESKIVKIVLLILISITIFGNNRYAIRYKSIESINSGFLRFGLGTIIFNYYWIISGITSAKESVKMFEKRKLELEEREAEVVEG